MNEEILIVARELIQHQRYSTSSEFKGAIWKRVRELKLQASAFDVEDAIARVFVREVMKLERPTATRTVIKVSPEIIDDGGLPIVYRTLDELDALPKNDPERDEICKRLSPEDQVQLMKRYGLDWPPK